MTVDISTLGVAVDTTQVNRATRDLNDFARTGPASANAASQVERGIGGVATAAKKTATELANVGNAADKATSGLSSVTVSLSGLMQVIGLSKLAQLAGDFIKNADAMNMMHAKLQLVAGSGKELANTEAAIYQAAQKTRTEYIETANLYGKLAMSTQTLGISKERLLGTTVAVNQALQISGANASQAAASLMQLGQGLGSGTLRGEELNSVLENSPRLAQAIADGLGVTIAEMRKMGAEGKLSSEVVFAALESQAQRLQDEFESLPLTVSAAMTQMTNSVSQGAAEMDRALGATNFLSKLLSGTGEWLDQLRAGGRIVQGKNNDPLVLAEFEKARSGLEKAVKDGEAALKKESNTATRAGIMRATEQNKAALAELTKDLETARKANATSVDGTLGSLMRIQAEEKKALDGQADYKKNHLNAEEKYQAELTRIRSLGFSPFEESRYEAEALKKRDAELKAASRKEGSGGRSAAASAKREARRDAIEEAREERERQQTATEVMRNALEDQKEILSGENSVYNARLSVLKTYRAADMISEADYNAGTKAARDEHLSNLKESFGKEAEIIRARLNDPSLKDPSTRAKLQGDLNKVLREEASAIQDVQNEASKESLDSFFDTQRELKKVIEDNMEPLEQFYKKLEELQKLREKGLPEETYVKAVEKEIKVWEKKEAQKRMETDKTYEYMKAGASIIESTLGSVLVDGINGQLKDIGSYFEDFTKKILLQMAQIQLQKALFGASGMGGGSDGLGDGLIGAAGKWLGSMMGGARAGGGSTSGGSTYEVGELGPELFKSGGKTYMIPANDGNVTPTNRLGGGASVVVQVINQGKPAEIASQKSSTDGNGRQIIEMVLKEVASDIKSGGGVASAMQEQYGLNRAQGAT